jgi:hypothetical protein
MAGEQLIMRCSVLLRGETDRDGARVGTYVPWTKVAQSGVRQRTTTKKIISEETMARGFKNQRRPESERWLSRIDNEEIEMNKNEHRGAEGERETDRATQETWKQQEVTNKLSGEGGRPARKGAAGGPSSKRPSLGFPPISGAL